MRYPDWPSRLSSALAFAGRRGFAWGTQDCCLFACDVAKAITGVDYGASFRGRYSDQRGAVKALQEFGAGSLRDTVTAIMGPEIPLARACRGDMVMANQGHGNMLGICVGESVAFLTDRGFVYLKLASCKTAWRVG